MAKVGVALSGGGHRATVWAYGALLYLVDAEQHERVAAISSVSGGSIANGVVASRLDYTETDPEAFREAIKPSLRHIAHDGLFFFGPATNRYVYGVLALAAASVSALVAAVVLGIATTGLPVAVATVVFVLLLVLTVWRFSSRSMQAERALADVHFGETKLAEVKRRVVHLICATELQAGNHIYFSPEFVYGYRHGIGTPGPMQLATAVQASACLPGAFAPRRFPAAPFDFTRLDGVDEPATASPHIIANDGGVYDNMGDEWFVGYDDRSRNWPDLPTLCAEADELIVVNSSGGWGWQEISGWSRIKRELIGVLGSKDVLYNSSTRIRRRDLIETFRAHEKSGKGYVGALVHIPQSPFATADGFARGASARSDRARATLAALGDDATTRAQWSERAKHSTGVKTVLRKLGPDDTVGLLHHAYVLAMCNLHVVLGYPMLPMPTEQQFRDLIET